MREFKKEMVCMKLGSNYKNHKAPKHCTLVSLYVILNFCLGSPAKLDKEKTQCLVKVTLSWIPVVTKIRNFRDCKAHIGNTIVICRFSVTIKLLKNKMILKGTLMFGGRLQIAQVNSCWQRYVTSKYIFIFLKTVTLLV